MKINYFIIFLIGLILGLLIQYNFLNTFNNNNNNYNNSNIYNKLYNIHNKLKLINGSLNEEIPEQLIVIQYIKPNDKVLELGGNYGRLSCVIAHILKNNNNLVVVETNNEYIKLLKENRDINKFNFKIENCAISKSELYLNESITKPINEITSFINWDPIKTITWNNFKNKYNINFNVLVVDCEGALYYILKDEPKFLENFKKIIIENDFINIKHKEFVDNKFKLYNFIKVYNEPGGIGPCSKFFYEVWEK